jgi:hypothetical protein
VLTDDNAESEEHFRKAWNQLQGAESRRNFENTAEPEKTNK